MYTIMSAGALQPQRSITYFVAAT